MPKAPTNSVRVVRLRGADLKLYCTHDCTGPGSTTLMCRDTCESVSGRDAWRHAHGLKPVTYNLKVTYNISNLNRCPISRDSQYSVLPYSKRYRSHRHCHA